MENKFEERPKLSVNSQGVIEEKSKEIDPSQFEELFDVKGTPLGDRIILQPLPEKEIKTSSGIVLTGNYKKEMKCAVVAVNERNPNSLKRGDVILIDPQMLMGGMDKVTYIEGFPCLVLYDHLIVHKYDINIADWKKDKIEN